MPQERSRKPDIRDLIGRVEKSSGDLYDLAIRLGDMKIQRHTATLFDDAASVLDGKLKTDELARRHYVLEHRVFINIIKELKRGVVEMPRTTRNSIVLSVDNLSGHLKGLSLELRIMRRQ